MNRGSQIDNLFTLIVITVAVLVLVISGFLVGSVETEFRDNTDMTNATINATVGNVQKAYGLIDTMIPLLFIGSGLGAAVLAYRAPSHPSYAFVSILMILIMLVASGFLGNMYHDVVTNSALSSTASTYVFTNFVMTNLFKLTLGFGFLVLIAGYMGVRSVEP